MDDENQGIGNFSAQRFEEAHGPDQIKQVPPESLRPFQGHTFQVRDDDNMKRLMESIKENGILEPALVFFNEEGELELISGHRRQKAAILLGLDVMPILIREVDRNQATILMGEANLTGREILPSEKAFTYKAMLEAMRQMPEIEEETSTGGRIRDLLAKRVGESPSQIYRIIRLTNLKTELLDLVDVEKLGLRPAVHLSYLPPEHQQRLMDIFTENGSLPTLDQAKRLHFLSEEGKLDENMIAAEMSKKVDSAEKDRISFRSPVICSLLSTCNSIAEREERIIRGLQLLEALEREQKGKMETMKQGGEIFNE